MKSVQWFSSVGLGLLFLVASLGCGVRTVTVSGIVSFDGVLAKDISVVFQPKTDAAIVPEAAYGLTNAEGRYSLKLVLTGKTGAIPGDYVVFLSWADPNADPNPIEGVTVGNPCPYKIPAKASRGGIPFTVPENGTKEADFKFTPEDSKNDKQIPVV